MLSSLELALHQLGLNDFFAMLEAWQIWAIFGCFIWGGFVRGAFSFGGAALSLPMLLVIYPQPLFFLPLIAVHLLFFGCFSVIKRLSQIDWPYLRKLIVLLLPTKILGILGLLQLPAEVLVIIIYGFSLFYAVNYLLLGKLRAKPGRATKITETVMLLFGGYMSGTALSGAPLIVAVVGKYVAKNSLRATLFALWTMLVIIKLAAMHYAGFSLQLAHHLWLLPAAAIGHLIGIRVYRYLHQLPDQVYYRVLGCILLLLGILGFVDYFL